MVTGTPVIYLYTFWQNIIYIKLFRYGAYIWSIPNMNFAQSYIANIANISNIANIANISNIANIANISNIANMSNVKKW